MKTILSILCLTTLCSLGAKAQTATSSKKNAQQETAVESPTVNAPDKSSATIISGHRTAILKEGPLENKENTGNTIPVTTETAPLSRKPE